MCLQESDQCREIVQNRLNSCRNWNCSPSVGELVLLNASSPGRDDFKLPVPASTAPGEVLEASREFVFTFFMLFFCVERLVLKWWFALNDSCRPMCKCRFGKGTFFSEEWLELKVSYCLFGGVYLGKFLICSRKYCVQMIEIRWKSRRTFGLYSEGVLRIIFREGSVLTLEDVCCWEEKV